MRALAMLVALVVSGCSGPPAASVTPAPSATASPVLTPSASPSPTPVVPPTPTPTPPDLVGTLLEDAQVGCSIGKAWAGTPGTALPELAGCNSPPAFDRHLNVGDLVYTDVCGQAVINSRCGTIYVFQDSRLQASRCAPGPASDALACVEYGAVGMDNTCHGEPVGFLTPNSSFALEGTWVGVFYLPDREVSLLIVLDGTATAVALGGGGESLSEPEPVGGLEFWFTAGGNQTVAGLDGRVAHRMEELPAVAHELGIETWLGSLFERAAQAKVDLSAVPQLPVINVRARGGVFDDPRAQEALLWAMDWAGTAKDVFPEGEGRIVGLIPSTEGLDPHDLSSWGLDFEKAQSLFEETGKPTADVIPLLADETGEILRVAEIWTQYLNKLNLPVEVTPLNPGEADLIYPSYGAGERPIIWLSTH